MGTRRRSFITTGALVGVAGLVVGLIPASAALPTPPLAPAASTQFDITGIIQDAQLDGTSLATGWSDPHDGGTITVNGQVVVVPKETVVILPANALTWQEVFSHAPAPYGVPGLNGALLLGGPASGLALDDPKLATSSSGTYEAHIVGNRVLDPNGVNGCTVVAGCDRYIAGLVDISQQSLNSGAGYINFIDYAKGVMYVGGTMGVASGTRVAINDPAVAGLNGGRFSRGFGLDSAGGTLPQDSRFQVDQDNPTIVAETGFPMCLPRTDPAGTTPDAACPEANRPIVLGTPAAAIDQSGITPQPNVLTAGQHYTLFRMDNPANLATPSLCLRTPCADPRQQAPFEIGDYVTFAGTQMVDVQGAPFVSAHTIVASVGIYTQTGVDPAYVTVDVSLIGTGGLTIFGAGEATARTRFEGMSTDESRPVSVYGVDIDPLTGSTSDRSWGSAMPDAGPPTGAVRGRWRFRPPCTDTTATMLASPGKGCTPPPAGQFIPPTREVRAAIQNVLGAGTATPTLSPANTIASGLQAANGISYGQYHAPIQEYIFPENVPGTPVPENNFNTIPFLAAGGYSSSTGVIAKVLSPWPSNVRPTSSVCAVANAGGSYSVKAGTPGSLVGSAGTNPTGTITYSWTIKSGVGTITPSVGQTITYNAPSNATPSTTVAAAVVTLTVTQNGAAGCPIQTTSDANIFITANAFAPVVNTFGKNATVTTSTATSFTVSAQGKFFNSAATPANGTTSFIGYFQIVQTAGPTLALPNNGRIAIPSGNCTINNRAAGNSCTTSNLPLVIPVPAGYLATTTYLGQAKFAVNMVLTSVVNSASGTLTNQLLPTGPTFATQVVLTASPGAGVGAIVLTPTKERNGKQRLQITATFAGPTTTVIKLLPYRTTTGTVYNPDPAAGGLGNTFTWDPTTATFLISLTGAPDPACNPGGAFATPCSATPLIVEATAAGAPGTIIATSPLAGTALSVII